MKNEKELDVERALENGVPHAVTIDSSPYLGEATQDTPVNGQPAEPEVLDEISDYSHFSKKELVDLVKELSLDSNFKKVDAILREIKPLYNEFYEKEKSEALSRYSKTDGVIRAVTSASAK